MTYIVERSKEGIVFLYAPPTDETRRKVLDELDQRWSSMFDAKTQGCEYPEHGIILRIYNRPIWTFEAAMLKEGFPDLMRESLACGLFENADLFNADDYR